MSYYVPNIIFLDRLDKYLWFESLLYYIQLFLVWFLEDIMYVLLMIGAETCFSKMYKTIIAYMFCTKYISTTWLFQAII